MTQIAGAGHKKGMHGKSQNMSRPASAVSDTGTLSGNPQEELPPSYEDHADFRNARDPQEHIRDFHVGIAPGPSVPHARDVSQPRTRPQPNPQQHLDPREVGPTASQPFHFPTNDVPLYSALDPIQKPLAIPQFQSSATSPFLSAYPTCLLSFGIPAESWRSFVNTLSAFLSAAVGTQAVQHAADIAWTLGEAHKNWALGQKDHVISLGHKAQRGDLFGVIGGTVGLTLGTAGHIVDSVLKFPRRLVRKPQSPKERADAYVATANKDWLNARGLHARIVDTSQLSQVAGASMDDFLESAKRTRSIGDQFRVLGEWIADMDIGDGQDMRPKPKAEVGKIHITAAPPLEITKKTLWLTLLKLDEEEVALAHKMQYA